MPIRVIDQAHLQMIKVGERLDQALLSLGNHTLDGCDDHVARGLKEERNRNSELAPTVNDTVIC